MSRAAEQDQVLLDFRNRVVLVTGGSSGIGNAAAQLFRALGAQVHVTGTGASADAYETRAGSNLDGLAYHQLDASDADHVAAFHPGLDRLDVLVNSIGAVAYKRAEFNMDTFARIVQTNLTSIMALCTAFQPMLQSSGGNIVNVGSVASFRQVLANPAYSASKGGLLTLTRSLAAAWAPNGVRVNLVAPGLIDTAMTSVMREHPDRYVASLATIPLGRWGQPRDIGHCIVFLASPLAAYVTGEMLVVDGGASV